MEKNNIKPANISEMLTERMIASTVASDFGIAIIPQIPDLELYNVKIMPIDDMVIRRPLYMMWKRYDYPKPIIQTFTNYVKQVFSL